MRCGPTYDQPPRRAARLSPHRPCDMRRGFDGLRVHAAHVIGVDPLAGHLFVFCGRRYRTRSCISGFRAMLISVPISIRSRFRTHSDRRSDLPPIFFG
ncbi:IS66 family insertion sequence element accessory protein TnpB [uncultured Paludibaculum sp.]|uniref:IS66 family insertion sequence element accessory protein TnpB n=1 Tax=uncultured Paludibaculum sp. TaxID=1765020 RepID=UPI00374D15E0